MKQLSNETGISPVFGTECWDVTVLIKPADSCIYGEHEKLARDHRHENVSVILTLTCENYEADCSRCSSWMILGHDI